jgi:hypothetical protein
MNYLKTKIVLACLIGSGATADQTMTDLSQAANIIMEQVKLSRTLAAGASYHAGVGGIAPDGSVTSAQLNNEMVSAYNDAIENVKSTTYYNTSMLLEDQSDIALDNMSTAIDALVDATVTFATVSAVAEIASEADTVQEQLEVQEVVSTTDMTISEADVEEYNTALADVETYAQEAAGFLSASTNTSLTSTSDQWAEQNNVSVASYSSVTYDATADILVMRFYSQNSEDYRGISFHKFLTKNFVTAEDIYNTGIAYGG